MHLSCPRQPLHTLPQLAGAVRKGGHVLNTSFNLSCHHATDTSQVPVVLLRKSVAEWLLIIVHASDVQPATADGAQQLASSSSGFFSTSIAGSVTAGATPEAPVFRSSADEGGSALIDWCALRNQEPLVRMVFVIQRAHFNSLHLARRPPPPPVSGRGRNRGGRRTLICQWLQYIESCYSTWSPSVRCCVHDRGAE